jgi:hypothetical protein
MVPTDDFDYQPRCQKENGGDVIEKYHFNQFVSGHTVLVG